MAAFYPIDNDKKALKSGWLRKQGGLVKSWNKKWFVLRNNHLYIYSTDDETKSEQDKISVVGCKIVELPLVAGDTDKYLFEIRDKVKSSELCTLCASTEDERHLWIVALKRVALSESGGGVFGRELNDIMKYELSKAERGQSPPTVPAIVRQCTIFLVEHGLDVEGIFRLPGRTSLVKELQNAFDEGRPVTLTLDTTDVQCVASLLKLFIRDLPSPLIPISSYQTVMKLTQLDMKINPEKALNDLAKVLTSIPQHSYNLLRHLCIFLKKVTEHADKNKMTAMNLASIFMQNFLKPEDDDPSLLMATSPGRTDATFLMIDKCRELFQTEYTKDGSLVEVKNLLGIDHSDHRLTLALGLNSSNSSDGARSGSDYEIIDSLPTPLEPQRSLSRGESDLCDSQENDSSIHGQLEKTSLSEEEWKPLRPGSTSSNASAHEAVMNATDASILRRNRSKTENGAVIAEGSSPPAKPHILRRYDPTVQRSSSLFSNTSTSSVDSSFLDRPGKPHVVVRDNVSNEYIDSLLDVEYGEFSRDELAEHTHRVCALLRQMQQRMSYLQAQHEAKLKQMAKKLNDEKEATGQTVEKVVALQAQLQKYHLHFGPI